METLVAIRGRKSTRAFLRKPVPKELIAQVLHASRWAPSGSNLQLWRVTVATGITCQTLASRLAHAARERQPEVPSSAGAPADVDGQSVGASSPDLAWRLGLPSAFFSGRAVVEVAPDSLTPIR